VLIFKPETIIGWHVDVCREETERRTTAAGPGGRDADLTACTRECMGDQAHRR
jgi:hypothetical protein